MDVFIGNLSAKTKLTELHNILGEFEMHSDFTTYEGKHCDHTKYHFVIVNTSDQQQAHKLIKRLKGFELKGRKLEVREYVHRNVNSQQQWDGVDRRINEQLTLAL